MKIVTIIGARPQIIKAAAFSRAIRNNYPVEVEEIIVHTGQHYDPNMSQVFIEQLEIEAPKYNLNAGSGAHGVQTAKMIQGIEEILLNENPNAIVLYGDTNSTLAGAVAASKLHIPIVHIEAGLRSFNKKMPEEVNRIMCDHVASMLFSPTGTGYQNLLREGFQPNDSDICNADHPKIYHCGDLMYDNSVYFGDKIGAGKYYLSKFGVDDEKYILCTIHRPQNTDDSQALEDIFLALLEVQANHHLKIVLPLHPRTKKLMEVNLSDEVRQKVADNQDIILTDPANFLEVIALEKNAEMLVTDSGGLQKEAYFFNKPCAILRPETEWTEIVAQGSAVLCGNDKNMIVKACNDLMSKEFDYPLLYGDGKAADFMIHEIVKYLK